jgi:hypothetical protein
MVARLGFEKSNFLLWLVSFSAPPRRHDIERIREPREHYCVSESSKIASRKATYSQS